MMSSASLSSEVSISSAAGTSGRSRQVQTVQAGRVLGEGDEIAGIPNLHVAAVSVGGGEEKSEASERCH